jgi:NTP pyrophosphatase (non-canonical NTP hydrolase)
MTRNQFLLLKLIEECAEVSHIASKQIQFGKDSTNRAKLDKTNAEHLKSEALDLMSVLALLMIYDEFPQWTPQELENAIHAKRAKMQKYVTQSYQLGQLPEIEL